jgi:hypothetical protein
MRNDRKATSPPPFLASQARSIIVAAVDIRDTSDTDLELPLGLGQARRIDNLGYTLGCSALAEGEPG